MKIMVSKLDAANRQLDAAIRLWFSDDDAVVIHALTWAAYQIVQDINDKKGNKAVTLVEMVRAAVKPELVEQTIRDFRKEMAFFKHADRDPYDILEFDTNRSASFMLVTIEGLKALGERVSDIQGVFLRWQLLHNKDWFGGGDLFLNKFTPEQIEYLRRLDKKEFLQQGVVGVASSKIKI